MNAVTQYFVGLAALLAKAIRAILYPIFNLWLRIEAKRYRRKYKDDPSVTWLRGMGKPLRGVLSENLHWCDRCLTLCGFVEKVLRRKFCDDLPPDVTGQIRENDGGDSNAA